MHWEARRTASATVRRQLDSQGMRACKPVPQGTKPGEAKENKQNSMPLLRQTSRVFFLPGIGQLPESFPKATALSLKG